MNLEVPNINIAGTLDTITTLLEQNLDALYDCQKTYKKCLNELLELNKAVDKVTEIAKFRGGNNEPV